VLHPLTEIELHFKINPKSTTRKIQQRPPLYQETTTPPSCKPNIQNPATTTTPPSCKQQTQHPKSTTPKLKSKVIQNNQIMPSTQAQAQARFQLSTTTPPRRDRDRHKPKLVSNCQPPRHHKINKEQRRAMENRGDSIEKKKKKKK
jgi:hypothetical protein